MNPKKIPETKQRKHANHNIALIAVHTIGADRRVSTVIELIERSHCTWKCGAACSVNATSLRVGLVEFGKRHDKQTDKRAATLQQTAGRKCYEEVTDLSGVSGVSLTCYEEVSSKLRTCYEEVTKATVPVKVSVVRASIGTQCERAFNHCNMTNDDCNFTAAARCNGGL